MNTYNCIQCGSVVPATTPYQQGARYLEFPKAYAGPFCTDACSSAWLERPYRERLETIWPSYEAAIFLIESIEAGIFVRDEPGEVAWRVDKNLSFIEHAPAHRCPQLASADYSIVNSVKRCPGCPRFELKPWNLLEIPIAAYGAEVVR